MANELPGSTWGNNHYRKVLHSFRSPKKKTKNIRETLNKKKQTKNLSVTVNKTSLSLSPPPALLKKNVCWFLLQN